MNKIGNLNRIKKMKAKHRHTPTCSYFDYNNNANNQLKSQFSDLIIAKNTTAQTLPLTGNNRDNSAIAIGKIKSDTSQMSNPEHTNEIPFAQKVRLKQLEPIEKYWIFKINFQYPSFKTR